MGAVGIYSRQSCPKLPKYRAEIFYCPACLQLVIIRPRCEACAKTLAALLSENRSWEPGRAGLEIISSYSRNLDSAFTVKGRGRLCEKSGELGEGLSGLHWQVASPSFGNTQLPDCAKCSVASGDNKPRAAQPGGQGCDRPGQAVGTLRSATQAFLQAVRLVLSGPLPHTLADRTRRLGGGCSLASVEAPRNCELFSKGEG